MYSLAIFLFLSPCKEKQKSELSLIYVYISIVADSIDWYLLQVQPIPNNTTDENTVRIANVQAPLTHVVIVPSTSTPTPGKQSVRRKINRRSASFSEMTSQRVSVFNIPPPPPFQPPQQLKENSTKNKSQLSLEIPKVTQLPAKKKSPSLPIPPPPADPPLPAVKPVDLTQINTESASVVTDEFDDPVQTLASVLSESPTDVDDSNPPPPPFHSIVNSSSKSQQHLRPPPRTHSIIGHTIPRARKSSLLATNVYRTASSGQEDHETNANQAFARLTGQRAPADVLRVGTSEGGFDRNATIKALSLMRSLELSMTVGCHITQRLYVPKNLW